MERELLPRTNFEQSDLFPAIDGLIAPHSIERQLNGAIVVRGQLLGTAEQIYRPLRARFEQLGYTPFIKEGKHGVEVVAAPGVIERRPLRWKLNLALFLTTIFTVLLTGAASEIGTADALARIFAQPSLLVGGVPFAATLLGILFAHEMGHFIVSRLRGAPASLPYFIPLPPGISFTGTMGAVIVQREPFEDRRTLLEVAIAGPLAGLAVAIPLLFYGLSISEVGAPPPEVTTWIQEGNSIFYALAKYAVFGQWLPGNGVDVQLSSVAFGAWIGLLVTMLNLLPVGQLDGGHVAYALLGRRAEWISYATLVIFLLMGLFVAPSWLVWTILIGLMGARHPQPFNDVTRLKPIHIVLGVIGLITFVLLFMPTPIEQVFR